MPGLARDAADLMGDLAGKLKGDVQKAGAVKDAAASVAATRARMMLSACQGRGRGGGGGVSADDRGVNRYKQSLRDKIKAEGWARGRRRL